MKKRRKEQLMQRDSLVKTHSTEVKEGRWQKRTETQQQQQGRNDIKSRKGTCVIFHVDVDCFFAAVSLRISTCNYVARTHGIRKGMFLRKAIELCPDLVVIPYDYEGYEEVSVIVGDILQKCTDLYGGTIEHVSCDEAYIELHLYGNMNGDRGCKKTGKNDNLNKLLLQEYRCDENQKKEDR